MWSGNIIDTNTCFAERYDTCVSLVLEVCMLCVDEIRILGSILPF